MKDKIFIVGFGILLGVAAFFSTYALTESPGLWYDEGLYLQMAENQTENGRLQIQLAPGEYISGAFMSGGFPFIYPLAASFELFGAGVLQARGVMALFIVSFVAVVFFLIRRLYGTTAALLACLLLVTFPLLYGNGKSALGEVPGLLYLTLFLHSVISLQKSDFRGVWRYVAAGIFAGLCLATKPIYLLLGPAVLVVLLIYRKKIIWRWRPLLVGVGSAALVLAWWAVTQFSLADATGALFSHYANPYEVTGVAETIIANMLRFATELTPLYFAVLFGAWAVSLAIRWYQRAEVSLAEAIAFLFTVCVALFYVRTAGWYRYFFPAHCLAIAFAPHALMTIAAYVRERWPAIQPVVALPILIGVIGAVSLLQLYQLTTTSYVATAYDNTVTAELTQHFAGLPDSAVIFFYNVPEAVIFAGGHPYYQYLHPVGSMVLGEQYLSQLSAGAVDIVVTTDVAAVVALNPQYHESFRVAGYTFLTR